MDSRKQDLIATLEDLADLLARHDEQRWADWIRQDIEHLARDDAYGVDHFLSAFGGMGSLNDVVLYGTSGPGGGRDQTADDELWRLRETAWEIAKALKQEAAR